MEGEVPMQNEAENQRQMLRQLPSLQCPRCNSMDTKFCYFNNNKSSQQRHLCKSCKRHWTRGGSIRNVREGAGVQIGMPIMSSGSSRDRIGPYYKITRINSLENLPKFNYAGSHVAGVSYTNISQAAAYNQELRLHPALQQDGNLGQLTGNPWSPPSNRNISQAAAHNQGFTTHLDVQQAVNFDQLTGFNYARSHVAGGSHPDISQAAAHNQGLRAHPDVPQMVRFDQLTGTPLWYPSGYNGASSSGYNGQTRNQNIVPDNHNQ